jgi:hypothetical protein
LLWVLLPASRKPTSHLADSAHAFHLICLQIAVGVAEEKLQPALPSNLPADLLVIATMCCDFDPGLRPSFDLIAEELHKVVQQMQVRAWVGRWQTPSWGRDTTAETVCVWSGAVDI